MNATFPSVEERRTLIFTSVNGLKFEAVVTTEGEGDYGIVFPTGDFVVWSDEYYHAEVYTGDVDMARRWDYQPIDTEKYVMHYELAAIWALGILMDEVGRSEADFVFADLNTD